MKKTVFLFICVIALQLQAFSRQPSIIIFLVDDMGWTDSGAYGSQYYETPNVDRLATQSMRFTDAYAHPLCSPSRASILTGQEESRHGIMSAQGHLPPDAPGQQVYQENPSANQPFLLPKSKHFLNPETVTLAEALKEAGYRTAHMGKWHLGLTPEYRPDKHGFEVTFESAPDPGPPGGTYFAPHKVSSDGAPTPNHPVGNIKDGPAGEHIADRLAQEAVGFIRAHKDEPFYLNLWQYNVHGPWEAKEAYIKAFVEKKDPTGRHSNPVMAAMLKSMDDSLGMVLKTLDDLGIADDTIFVFFSDNGGNIHSWATAAEQDKVLNNPSHKLHDVVKMYRKYAGLQPPTSNLPLRKGKSDLYEGGVRVPLMVRWPGKVAAGTTSDAIVNNIDLYPTLLELAGVPKPKGHIVDGESFVPVLLEGKPFCKDTSFHWFPYQDAGITVRKGDWKLIRRFKENPREYEGMVELYNLKDDLGESRNLARQMPEKVAELGRLIDEHFKSTGGLYPVPNPGYRKQAAPQPGPVSQSIDTIPQARGLVPKQCEVAAINGGIRVMPTGKMPFLGTAQVKLTGPLTLRLRARTVDGAGGTGRVQWKNKDQEEFPSSGQTISYAIPPGEDWQDIEVSVPAAGAIQIVRLYLAGPKAMEIQTIEWVRKGRGSVQWNFADLKK